MNLTVKVWDIWTVLPLVQEQTSFVESEGNVITSSWFVHIRLVTTLDHFNVKFRENAKVKRSSRFNSRKNVLAKKKDDFCKKKKLEPALAITFSLETVRDQGRIILNS